MSEPVAPRDRLATLDVLRGFALLGVLVGNIFHLYNAHFARWLEPTESRWDVVAGWCVTLFVQSKAQTLLTFLFGFGFAAQLIRARERAEPIVGLYVRRMLVLLGFGIAHVALLWWGDVTWTYAVAGFGLLPFLRASNRVRVISAAVVIFVPVVIYAFPGAWQGTWNVFGPSQPFDVYATHYVATLYGSSRLAIMHASVYMAWIWSAGAVGSYFPWLVGRFLLGYVAGVLHWFDADGAAHLVAFRRVLIGGAIAGALGTAYTVAAMLHAFAPIQDITAVRIAAGVLNELDYLGLAAVYLAAIVLLMQRARWRRVLVVLAPVGRMPLTVYLSQSLIVTTLLYGPGLGWLRWISPTGCIGLALAIFGVQLALCTWWLRYFRFGPLEWVWRALVYMKRPAMRI